MKKMILAVLCMMTGLVLADEPQNFYVLTNSQMIACFRDIKTAVVWTNGMAVRQGMQCSSYGSYYWAMRCPTNVAGANYPRGMLSDVSDGNVTWRNFDKGPRKGIIIVNDSTNTVYVSLANHARMNTGIRLNGSGGSVSVAAFQGPVYAICAVNSNLVTIQEW